MTSPRRLRAVPVSARRGVALVRVSKARGREDLISPQLQRTAIADYAARSGIDVVEWVEVLDESASSDRSPWWRTLERAVGAVEAGERGVVLVWKFSRAARHRKRWAVALDRIEVAGGTLESATEGLDTTTSTGRLARGMLAELAAWESEVKGEQWKETQARRLSLGLPHSGGRRFGYAYDKHAGFTPDPEQAPLLVALYRRYAAGDGFLKLTTWLNAQGVPTMRGGPWTANTLIRQLDSGFAAGLLYQPKTRAHLPGAQPPIITAEEWDAYRATRDRLRKMPARARRPIYPLTGLVRCGLCGQAMSAYSTKRGRGYMYRCTGYASGRTCTGVWLARSTTEKAVRDWVGGEARDIEIRARTKTAGELTRTIAKTEADRCARRVNRLNEQLVKLTVDLTAGLVPEIAYAAARDQLLEETAVAAGQLAELTHQVGMLQADYASKVVELDRAWDVLAVPDRRDMLAQVVRRIRICPDLPRVRISAWWDPET